MYYIIVVTVVLRKYTGYFTNFFARDFLKYNLEVKMTFLFEL